MHISCQTVIPNNLINLFCLSWGLAKLSVQVINWFLPKLCGRNFNLQVRSTEISDKTIVVCEFIAYSSTLNSNSPGQERSNVEWSSGTFNPIANCTTVESHFIFYYTRVKRKPPPEQSKSAVRCPAARGHEQTSVWVWDSCSLMPELIALLTQGGVIPWAEFSHDSISLSYNYTREELLLCTCTNCGRRNANWWKALNEFFIGCNIRDTLEQSEVRQNEGSGRQRRNGW